MEGNTVDLLSCYQEMIKVHGWNGTAATLGMNKSQLEARVYEVKGSGMRVDTALLIQTYSGTSHFAQANSKSRAISVRTFEACVKYAS